MFNRIIWLRIRLQKPLQWTWRKLQRRNFRCGGGRTEGRESAGNMKAAFRLAVFTETTSLCWSIVPSFLQPRAIARFITPHFHSRMLMDTFMRCNTICGGCEKEPVLWTPRRHEARMHECPPPLDKLKVKHTENASSRPDKASALMLNGLTEYNPPGRVNGRNMSALHSVSEQRCAVTVDPNNLSYYNMVFCVGRHTAQLIKNALFSRKCSFPHLRATAYTGPVMSWASHSGAPVCCYRGHLARRSSLEMSSGAQQNAVKENGPGVKRRSLTVNESIIFPR